MGRAEVEMAGDEPKGSHGRDHPDLPMRTAGQGAGARPGRTGRCPACGGVLEVPPGPEIDPSEVMLDAEQSANLRSPDLADDDEDLRSPWRLFRRTRAMQRGRTGR